MDEKAAVKRGEAQPQQDIEPFVLVVVVVCDILHTDEIFGECGDEEY